MQQHPNRALSLDEGNNQADPDPLHREGASAKLHLELLFRVHSVLSDAKPRRYIGLILP